MEKIALMVFLSVGFERANYIFPCQKSILLNGTKYKVHILGDLTLVNNKIENMWFLFV